MDSVSCNLCGADDYRVRFEAGEAQLSRVVECKHCGLMYANPRGAPPDVEEVQAWDADYVESHIETNGRLDKEALQVRDYAGTRRMLSERFPERGRLLEVGSGLGYLLDYFRKDGWDVLGVEPNVGMARHAQKKLGIDVFADILSAAEYPDNSFDVALMMHVIEHVPDPVEVLSEIYRVLKPGGMLVMETPRYDTLMFKIFGRRERSLSCDGHIYFFTSDTLRKISEKAGFRVERADKVGRSLTLERLTYNLGVVLRSKALRGVLDGLVRKLGIDDAAVTINLRDMERIYLTKPAGSPAQAAGNAGSASRPDLAAQSEKAA